MVTTTSTLPSEQVSKQVNNTGIKTSLFFISSSSWILIPFFYSSVYQQQWQQKKNTTKYNTVKPTHKKNDIKNRHYNDKRQSWKGVLFCSTEWSENELPVLKHDNKQTTTIIKSPKNVPLFVISTKYVYVSVVRLVTIITIIIISWIDSFSN